MSQIFLSQRFVANLTEELERQTDFHGSGMRWITQGTRTTNRTSAHKRLRRGFSIIELTVALIIAAMALPRINYERYRADAAMRTVRTVLMSAERNAIMRQTDLVIGFDVSGRTMEILEDANNNCTYDSGERLTRRPLEEGTKFALTSTPYPATSPSGPISGSNLCTMHGFPAVAFLRDGAASTDADIYVASSRGQTTDFRLIRITQASGRTDAFKYTGSSWMRTN
jgi:prepilin-type N-terminal cleavage/methylation domain-containing protein